MKCCSKLFLACAISVALLSCSTANDPVVTPPTNNTGNNPGTNDPGTSSTSPKTAGSLAVSLTTSSYKGDYAPKHVVAVWITNNSGTFVKTLLLNAAARKQHLTNWMSATSTGNTTDAVTSATLSSHGVRTCTWNGTDVSGNVVADGTYKLCMEFTESNGTGKFASFAFDKDGSAHQLTPAATSNFSDISIKWTPK